MEILKFKGKMSLKNKILLICLGVFAVLILSVVIIYITIDTARDWININFLRQEVTEYAIAKIKI